MFLPAMKVLDLASVSPVLKATVKSALGAKVQPPVVKPLDRVTPKGTENTFCTSKSVVATTP